LSETGSFGRSPFLKKKGAARPTEKTSVVRAGLFTSIFPSANQRKERIYVAIPNAALNIDEEIFRFYWASGRK